MDIRFRYLLFSLRYPRAADVTDRALRYGQYLLVSTMTLLVLINVIGLLLK